MFGLLDRILHRSDTVDMDAYDYEQQTPRTLDEMAQNVTEEELLASPWIEEFDLEDVKQRHLAIIVAVLSKQVEVGIPMALFLSPSPFVI